MNDVDGFFWIDDVDHLNKPIATTSPLDAIFAVAHVAGTATPNDRLGLRREDTVARRMFEIPAISAKFHRFNYWEIPEPVNSSGVTAIGSLAA